MSKRVRPCDCPCSHAVDQQCDVETRRHCRALRDNGLSLIEVLISIVLMGLVITATLSLLRVTIMASGTDRDHSNAHAWMQTASDVLYASPFVSCAPAGSMATNKASIIDAYENTMQQTDNPEDWPDGNIEIYDLQFWHINMDPVTKFAEEGWGNLCDSSDTNLQRVGMEVRSIDGKIVERVEVIIGE